MTLPCLVCGRELESAIPASVRNPSGNSNQPYAGTTFWTSGHYGSTVFDPQTPMVELHLNVCDPCLLERCGRLARVVRRRREEFLYEPWNPTTDDDSDA